ncbi:MAG: glycosyl transferase family 1 [Mucilaginibacter sp.]|nr:glycosyl transferase family 1 [Mucilaginibacter sp.]
MKILHVVDSIDAEKGGVSQAVQIIVAESVKNGIWTEVISIDYPTYFIDNSLFTVHALGPSKTPWSYSGKLIPWLLKNISRFDVIIIHGLWLYQSYGVTKALKIFKNKEHKKEGYNSPKLFIMPHGMLDPYFQHSKGRKIKAIRNWLYWKLIEGHVVNKADGILFTCREECRLANDTFRPYHPKYKAIVGLGIIEPPAFNYAMHQAFLKKCPGIKNNSYILFLGRIDPKKGIDHLINAYGKVINEIRVNEIALSAIRVLKNGTDSANSKNEKFPKLVIAGPGLETPYGKKIHDMVSSNPFLSASVFFTGMLEGEAKWGAFYNCDAFLLPSHQENFGIAVVEALACSKPVLISKQVNISYEIKAFGGGLVDDDSLEGTCNILKSWFKMPHQDQITMGVQARKCFENYFAAGPAVDKVIKAVSAKY